MYIFTKIFFRMLFNFLKIRSGHHHLMRSKKCNPMNSLHTSSSFLNGWIQQQGEAIKMQEDRRSQIAARNKKEKLEEIKNEEEQDEAIRNELKAREKSMPKDKLDESYFKDKERFKIHNDKRDPLYANLKEETNAQDWKSYFSEGMKESRETFSKIKESQPFTFSQTSMSGGRFGYRTYSLGEGFAGTMVVVFFIVLANELCAEYQENCEVKKTEREIRERRLRL